MHEPQILILDEPTSGLDPIMQNIFYNLLKEEKEKGTTIFYSTHILSEVSKICDRVGIIKDGQLIKIEDIDNISQKNLVSITITSDYVDEIIENLKIKIIYKENNIIKFNSQMPSDELIKKLSKYKIDKILIQEPTLEEIFMHYYKKEN